MGRRALCGRHRLFSRSLTNCAIGKNRTIRRTFSTDTDLVGRPSLYRFTRGRLTTAAISSSYPRASTDQTLASRLLPLRDVPLPILGRHGANPGLAQVSLRLSVDALRLERPMIDARFMSVFRECGILQVGALLSCCD